MCDASKSEMCKAAKEYTGQRPELRSGFPSQKAVKNMKKKVVLTGLLGTWDNTGLCHVEKGKDILFSDYSNTMTKKKIILFLFKK